MLHNSLSSLSRNHQNSNKNDLLLLLFDGLWKVKTNYMVQEDKRIGRSSLFDTNVPTGFMISIFLAAPAPGKRRARNLMKTSVGNGQRFFLFFGKTYYFVQKLSFLINPFVTNAPFLYHLKTYKTLRFSDVFWG